MTLPASPYRSVSATTRRASEMKPLRMSPSDVMTFLRAFLAGARSTGGRASGLFRGMAAHGLFRRQPVPLCPARHYPGVLLQVDLQLESQPPVPRLRFSSACCNSNSGYHRHSLGILAHSALALGLVALSFVGNLRLDLMGYLFGDVLAVSRSDLLWIWIGGASVLLVLTIYWRRLLLATVHEELASAEGVAVLRIRLTLMLTLAVTIAVAMKIVGILLITSMLILPAAAARRFARSPEEMAILAAGLGVVAVGLGLAGSLRYDTPSGPSIVVAALLLFILSLAGGALKWRK